MTKGQIYNALFGISAFAFIFVVVWAVVSLFEISLDEKRKSDDWRTNRTVVKICRDGTKVYSYKNKNWVEGSERTQVSVPLREVCE